MSNEPWIVSETWEGDGTGGAHFKLPDGTVVFVSEWTDRGVPGEMTQNAFEHACKIRDLAKAAWEEPSC